MRMPDESKFVEATVDAFLRPDRLAPDEYERKLDEYRQEYEDAVIAAQQVLGPPVFNGVVDDEGFPDDQDSLLLALWQLSNARLMIQQKHEDKELPIRLSVVAAPPQG